MSILILIICLAAAYWLFARPTPKYRRHDHNRIDPSDAATNNEATTKVSKARIYAIQEAIALGRDVHIRYEKGDGTVTRRTVTPRELRKLTIPELQRLLGTEVKVSKEGRLCLYGYSQQGGSFVVAEQESKRRINNVRPDLVSPFHKVRILRASA